MVTQILGQGSFGITYKVKAFTMVKGSFGEERYEFPQPKAVKEFFMKELNGRTESGSVTGISSGSLSYNYAQKFRSEAGNLAKMKHQNIVRVIDFIEANGTYYYVMDYVEGENLNEYIKHNKLTENEVVDIIRKVADALIYMHEEQKMLHLDLKPGNIMRRSSDGHIFLIDFGLSKHFSDNGTPETSTTVGFGTAGYAPVEQSNGTASAQFRPTIDVYALGATMYKLLTRETPPTSSDLVNDEEFIKDSLYKYSVSKNIAKVIIKAMSPRVKDRQQSVEDFVKELPKVKSDEFSNRDHSGAIDNANKDDETRIEHAKPIVEVKSNTQTKRGLLHSLIARYTQRYEERHIVTNIVLYGIQIVGLLSLIVLGVVMIHLSRTYRYLTYSIPFAMLLVSVLIGNSMLLRWEKKGLYIFLMLYSLIPWVTITLDEISYLYRELINPSIFIVAALIVIGLYVSLFLKKNGCRTWNTCASSKKSELVYGILLYSLSNVVNLNICNNDLDYWYEKNYKVFDVVQCEIPDDFQGRYIIPYGTNNIVPFAFSHNSKLTAVEIPSSVNRIGSRAFESCLGLQAIRIPNGVTVIGEMTFLCCSNLKTVTIPSSVQDIGDNIFDGCDQLETIYVPTGMKETYVEVFGEHYRRKIKEKNL